MKNTTLTSLLGWYSKLAIKADDAENNADTNNLQLDDTRIAKLIKRHIRELSSNCGADSGPLYQAKNADDCEAMGMTYCPIDGSCVPKEVGC